MKRALFVTALMISAPSVPSYAQDFSAAQIERGRYVATASDCAACHTKVPDGEPFAGGYPISSPLGTIYSTNITPSRRNGIGAYTLDQFDRALRRGVRADGGRLYPGMPYTSYAAMSRSDVAALYAYFMKGVAPVDRAPPRTKLPFPLNLRLSMVAWNVMFLDDRRFQPDPSKSAQWNRGAYLATLEHCSTCHSPRGFLMEERKGALLAGGPLGAWYAPNITSDPVSGIGKWSKAELIGYFATGRAPGKGQAAGGMAEAVTHSLSKLTPNDLDALATYVASVSPVRDQGATKAAFEFGKPLALEASLRGASAGGREGAMLYSGLCSSCHGATGAGSSDGAIPSLFNNSSVGAGRPDNLIAVILYGVDRTVGDNHVMMPGFGSGSFVQSLNDAQIASVASFVRQNFGPGDTVTADAVATARAGGPGSSLLIIIRLGMIAGALLFFWLGMRGVRRMRRRAPA